MPLWISASQPSHTNIIEALTVLINDCSQHGMVQDNCVMKCLNGPSLFRYDHLPSLLSIAGVSILAGMAYTVNKIADC